MSEQEPTKANEGAQDQGLGFSKLAMNEIAPAVTVEPEAPPVRTGKAWLIAIVVLAVAIGAWFMVQSALNFPPPSNVQEQFRDQVSALPYSQDGTIQEVKFDTGTSLQITFSSTTDTQDADVRATLRQATMAVLKLLAKVVPGKDLTITGYQGETKIVEANYSPTGAFVGDAKRGELDAVLWVKDGEQDTIGSSRGNARRGASESGQ